MQYNQEKSVLFRSVLNCVADSLVLHGCTMLYHLLESQGDAQILFLPTLCMCEKRAEAPAATPYARGQYRRPQGLVLFPSESKNAGRDGSKWISKPLKAFCIQDEGEQHKAALHFDPSA